MKTRFAPSPTGYLHRGHVWSALCTAAVAKAKNASMHLRLEDHDTLRCTPHFADEIRRDLEWLGFAWSSESVQSERAEIYQHHFNELLQRNFLFGCSCTRSQIRNGIYAGNCRNLHLPFEKNTVRFRLPEQTLIRWHDERCGDFEEDVATSCGDFVLRDRNGMWTYQFAVVVDDWEENIDLIVRGEDLLSSTARQLLLASTLGRKKMPTFLHHGLLLEVDGNKLSKRDGAAGICAERKAGVSPKKLLAEVCREAMPNADIPQEISWSEAINLYQLYFP
ncbi:MAG: tRNA glutamyl-Q(34) synthetase GluQRS [Prevotellaceae bacterium]|nr:tRNA glutamyl-Q(34) synthetase GluQRS [Prevotellaceae bacterium]